MCKFSLELSKQREFAKGLKLQVAMLPNIHDNETLGFGVAPASASEVCDTGVCLKEDAGLMFFLNRTQVVDLRLSDKVACDSGVALFGRFVDGGDHYEDGFNFEINGEVVYVAFDIRFLGVKAEVVAMPGEEYPPTEVSKHQFAPPPRVAGKQTVGAFA